jgi:hypothetical protein
MSDDVTYCSIKEFGPFTYSRHADARTLGIRIPNILTLQVSTYTPGCALGLNVTGDVEKITVPVTVGYKLSLPYPWLRVSVDAFTLTVTASLGKN